MSARETEPDPFSQRPRFAGGPSKSDSGERPARQSHPSPRKKPWRPPPPSPFFLALALSSSCGTGARRSPSECACSRMRVSSDMPGKASCQQGDKVSDEQHQLLSCGPASFFRASSSTSGAPPSASVRFDTHYVSARVSTNLICSTKTQNAAHERRCRLREPMTCASGIHISMRASARKTQPHSALPSVADETATASTSMQRSGSQPHIARCR